ncbi:hypothetical protein RJG79_02945 [Mycoplasmatota bacterium WC44]
MIREVRIDEVEEVAKYAYKLNCMPKHNCKSFSTEYEDILKSYKRDINVENKYLLGYFINDKLEGVVSIGAEPDENYVQTGGGIFAENDYQKISKEFYEWIKNNFKGYYFYMAYSQENLQAIEFSESQNLKCCSRAYFLRIKHEEFRPAKVNVQIEMLTEKYYDQFTELHDVIGEGAYWNSEKIISRNLFDVYLAIENDEVIGEFVVRKSLPEGEVYFLGVKEGISTNVLSDLIIYATKDRLSKGIETMAYVECNSIDELNAYFKLGYHISETSIGYEIDEL